MSIKLLKGVVYGIMAVLRVFVADTSRQATSIDAFTMRYGSNGMTPEVARIMMSDMDITQVRSALNTLFVNMSDHIALHTKPAEVSVPPVSGSDAPFSVSIPPRTPVQITWDTLCFKFLLNTVGSQTLVSDVVLDGILSIYFFIMPVYMASQLGMAGVMPAVVIAVVMLQVLCAIRMLSNPFRYLHSTEEAKLVEDCAYIISVTSVEWRLLMELVRVLTMGCVTSVRSTRYTSHSTI